MITNSHYHPQYNWSNNTDNLLYRHYHSSLSLIIITYHYSSILTVCARSMTGSLIEGQNLLILIGGIVLSIVLIGVVLALIYRLWTYIQDRKEYAQWVKDQQDANWEKVRNIICYL